MLILDCDEQLLLTRCVQAWGRRKDGTRGRHRHHGYIPDEASPSGSLLPASHSGVSLSLNVGVGVPTRERQRRTAGWRRHRLCASLS